jgi:hypothetical protein
VTKQKATELDREAAYGQFPNVSSMLASVRRGEFDAKLTAQLSEVIAMVKAAYKEGIKKPGQLVIRVTVDPVTDIQVSLSVDSQSRGPKIPAPSAILYVDDENRLATDDPYAYRFELATLAEPANGRLIEVDLETGEVL